MSAAPAITAHPAALPQERSQSLGEEIANSISHGVALLAAVAAAPILVLSAVQRGGAAGIVGASLFAATMVLLYASSMLYHALTAPRVKKIFQVLDHSAIYLLIAGTYTPFTLGVLHGPWGWTLFGLVWSMALAGVAVKAVAGIRYPWLSTVLYVAMGWVALIAIKPLWQLMPAWGLFWLVAGGLFYTLGVGFFATDHRLRYGHFVWHLFVAAGTVCHFFAVLYYAA
ncbi:hemolysin III family protein [Polaromonas sp.]|uniref:PAQR family membrane homeostasis protein TrhA n=1 Tax=Polaromonas sp. TaxID=1869339 RepID=UPI00286C983A|nr:hemolysin III family protein [Polaromonas sp.]